MKKSDEFERLHQRAILSIRHLESANKELNSFVDYFKEKDSKSSQSSNLLFVIAEVISGCFAIYVLWCLLWYLQDLLWYLDCYHEYYFNISVSKLLNLAKARLGEMREELEKIRTNS